MWIKIFRIKYVSYIVAHAKNKIYNLLYFNIYNILEIRRPKIIRATFGKDLLWLQLGMLYGVSWTYKVKFYFTVYKLFLINI